MAYELASQQLASIKDIEEQCRKSGAQYVNSCKPIILEYLGHSYQISFPSVEISLKTGTAAVPLKDKILMLHYLTRARGTSLSNKLITYKDLPEGSNYYPTFSKRAIKPVLDNFGAEPQRLLKVAAKLGGYKANFGDLAATMKAFPQVPVTVVIWRGDAEFPPEGNLLFDSTITDYLDTEDINILCENLAWRLVTLSKTGDN